jgi:hypothetical protein
MYRFISESGASLVVAQKIEHVPVALVSLAHTIQFTAFDYVLSRAFVLVVPGIPLLPMAEAQGLSGAGIDKESNS